MQVSMRHSVMWMGLSQGAMFVIQFGGSVVMARLLTPYEMGVYAVAAATVGLFVALRVFGLSAFLIREPDLTPAVAASAFTINAMLSVAVAALVAALSGAGAWMLGEPGVQTVMVVLAITPLLGIFDTLPAALLERSGAFKTMALAALARSAVGVGATIVLAIQGWSYMSIAYGNFVGAVFGMVLMNVVGWQHASLRLSLHDWRRITRFGVQMLTITGIGNISLRLSDILLGRLIGLGALGLYSRASGLHSMLWDNLHQIVARIVFVDFAEQRRRGMSLRATYLRVTALVTALLWPAFAGLGILAGPVIHAVYGPNWVEAALPLSLLAISGIVLVSNTMASETYIVCNETPRQLRYEAKRAGTGLVLFALGCLGGLGWAAASRIGEAAFGVAYSRRDILRMTNTTVADFRPVFGQSALLTVAACSPAAVVMAVNGWSAQTSLLAIAGAVALGIAAWGLGLWLLRHPLFDEARILARQAFRPLRDA